MEYERVSKHLEYNIGENAVIGNNAILGKLPKRAKTSTMKEQDYAILSIGNNVIIGDNVIIYAGTVIKDNVFIGDNTLIRENCIINDNVLVGSGVTIEQCTEIGANTKIQAKVYITAFTTIGHHCFLSPCVVFSNDNFVSRSQKRFALIKGPVLEDYSRIGAGAVLLPGVRIGKDGMVGAGSVVYHDVPPRKVVWGVPARVMKNVPKDELWENQ